MKSQDLLHANMELFRYHNLFVSVNWSLAVCDTADWSVVRRCSSSVKLFEGSCVRTESNNEPHSVFNWSNENTQLLHTKHETNYSQALYHPTLYDLTASLWFK